MISSARRLAEADGQGEEADDVFENEATGLGMTPSGGCGGSLRLGSEIWRSMGEWSPDEAEGWVPDWGPGGGRRE